MYKFNINKLNLNSVNGIVQLLPKKINVIVGPNNSGKSRLLKELRDYLSGDFRDIKILSDMEFVYPEKFTEINEAYGIESKMARDQYGNWTLKVYTNKPSGVLDMTSSLESYFTRNLNSVGGNWYEHYEGIIERKSREEFFYWFGPLFFQYLGTEERLTICKTQHNYGLDTNSANYLSSFKFNEKLWDELECKVKKLFSKDIYLDSQTLGDRLAIRVGEDFGYIRKKVITDENEARKLYEESLLDAQGDGLKSFVSTFLSLNYSKNNILLLDEPEAFLHPPLARQLGEMIGETQNEGKTIFIATHSVEVLKGILSKCEDVNVIRITQPETHVNEIKILEQDILKSILRNPFLRVSRVLEGIFCDKVVITEAEADELVYQELLEKFFPESGLYFAHGQNKQTLATIAELYQKIGIAFEIIVDFDVLRKPSEFYEFLKLMPLEERDKQRMQNYAQTMRHIVNNSVDISGLSAEEIEKVQKSRRDDVYHKQGIRYFEEKYRTLISNTLDKLSYNHLHILRSGELETLLEDYGVRYQDKKVWTIAAINKIAEIQPEDVDKDDFIYKFISGIVSKD